MLKKHQAEKLDIIKKILNLYKRTCKSTINKIENVKKYKIIFIVFILIILKRCVYYISF